VGLTKEDHGLGWFAVSASFLERYQHAYQYTIGRVGTPCTNPDDHSRLGIWGQMLGCIIAWKELQSPTFQYPSCNGITPRDQ
jgi:hypothetical protein